MKNIPKKIYLMLGDPTDVSKIEDFNQFEPEQVYWTTVRNEDHDIEYTLSEHSTKEQVINFALEAITRRDELAETADTKPVFEYENKWLTIDELYCEFFETPVKK